MEIRPIGEVYGVTNLYRDIRNMDNANHIEEKLARLEQKAATTITLIHNSIPDGAFNISRAELGNLRKFLFTMHVRHDACSREYFDKDHPGNARSREFLQAYMAKYGFHTSEELWLYFMNYLLDTPLLGHGPTVEDVNGPDAESTRFELGRYADEPNRKGNEARDEKRVETSRRKAELRGHVNKNTRSKVQG